MYFTLLDLSGKDLNFIASCDSTHLGGNTGGSQGEYHKITGTVWVGLQGANKSAHWDGWEIENPLELYCRVIGITPVLISSWAGHWFKSYLKAGFLVKRLSHDVCQQCLSVLTLYHRTPNIFGHPQNCCNYRKGLTMWIYHRVMSPKDVDGMANSVDPDQTRSNLI